MEARKAQMRALTQAIDTDADGVISKGEFMVYMTGANGGRPIRISSDVIWESVLEGLDKNADKKVRWPLRCYAALAESRCCVHRSL